MSTTTDLYQSKRGWAWVALGLTVANGIVFAGLVSAWCQSRNGLVFFAGLWIVENVVCVLNVRDDRRQAPKVVLPAVGHVPAIGRVVIVGGESESYAPCNHDPVNGRCVLCGTPIDLEPDER